MLGRWIFAAVLLVGVGAVIVALELTVGARGHVTSRRPASVADVVTGRSEEPGLPTTPEVDEAPPATSPAITY